eukprot:GHVU01033219.1.p3 GENE.GHVU01033219.1~~GHVU01033219.1.p3  ORF type:complete len:108 (-),score=3.81 GHVU01033219.1:1295-1618(-)
MDPSLPSRRHAWLSEAAKRGTIMYRVTHARLAALAPRTVVCYCLLAAHWRDYQYGAETAPEEDYQDDYDQVRTVRREVPQNQYYYQWTLCATASWIGTCKGDKTYVS